MRWAEHVARIGQMRNFDRKTERIRLLDKPRNRGEDNGRMDLRELRRRYVDWMHLLQDWDQWRAVVNTVMNFRVP